MTNRFSIIWYLEEFGSTEKTFMHGAAGSDAACGFGAGPAVRSSSSSAGGLLSLCLGTGLTPRTDHRFPPLVNWLYLGPPAPPAPPPCRLMSLLMVVFASDVVTLEVKGSRSCRWCISSVLLVATRARTRSTEKRKALCGRRRCLAIVLSRCHEVGVVCCPFSEPA